ncbi:MAG: MBL fold metallo-hydrolase [Polaromonas sp.]|uniref:MBL fold metallo-hydrolase n=1 Tax=Polaromonas sp. TaxID=1869339 RepID=UPI0017E9F59B|nr:MBL fold metallo-hydrolase [Polaromonas sp.]NMM08829.1 MBL fold metallo-hydrolase [Polaromonas sp.]
MSLPLAKRWFERRVVDVDLTLIWEPHVHPLLRCNIWHLRGRAADLLVDTGLGVASLRTAARDLFDKSLMAVATHAHADHVGSLHEFDARLIHRDEAASLLKGRESYSLDLADYDAPSRARLARVGYDISGGLLTAAPHQGYLPGNHRQQGVEPTRVLVEGDVVDLGDRAFEVLHLPGHSPGSIGLWEAATGLLFSGDAIYDGPLLDEIPGADIAVYRHTMERLLTLPVSTVHGGHDGSFGAERLAQIAQAYLRRTDRLG